MKKYLKYSGIAAAVVALVGWILLMACPALYVKGASIWGVSVTGDASPLAGVKAIFGDANNNFKPLGTALATWIILTIVVLVLIAEIVLPLVKIDLFASIAKFVNPVATLALVTCGILSFCVYADYLDGNTSIIGHIGAGWVIGGILLISAGALAILPAVFAFIDSNKK